MGKNPTGASKEAGLSASAIRNIIEGKSESPRAKTLKALARVLDTTEKWLTDGEGPETVSGALTPASVRNLPDNGGYRPPPEFFSPDRNMPVYSAAEGGDGFIIVSKDPIEYVRRPHTLEAVSDAYAILVTGESMKPAFRPEDKAWVNPRLPPAKDKDCVFYSIDEYNESKATIKHLIAWTDDYWLVEQHNPPKRFKLPRPVWNLCHRIVGKFSA